MCTLEVNLHINEFLVQAPDVGNEGAVVNDLNEISKAVCHSLHLAAISFTTIALNEYAELSVEMKSSRLVVANELVLDGEPCGERRAVVFTHAVPEIDSDHAEDQG